MVSIFGSMAIGGHGSSIGRVYLSFASLFFDRHISLWQQEILEFCAAENRTHDPKRGGQQFSVECLLI